MIGLWDPNIIQSYDGRHTQKVLSQHKWHKKSIYHEALLERQRHFTPIILSLDGAIGKDTMVATKELTDDLKKMIQGVIGNIWVCMGP